MFVIIKNKLPEGRRPWRLWLRGAPHYEEQHMPVKARIEIHEELLRGSFHAEDPVRHEVVQINV